MADKPPKGRPENLTATRYQKGQSGNAGGRPKSLPRFRARCRKLTLAMVPEAERRLRDKATPTGEWTRLWAELADRGGLLRASDQAEIDATIARLMIAAMGVKAMSREQRESVLRTLAGELSAVSGDAR